MKDAVLHFAGESVPAARALAEGAALAASLGDEGPRVSLYGAGLSGETVALGAWQRRATAGVPDDAELVRRRTGGIACHAGEGIVYVALGLRTASELMACPRDRVLNRNVRGLLAGLSLGGVPAHYFGRDFVSIAHRPAALIAWDRDKDGRVLFEAFIARTRTVATWRDKSSITLTEAWGREPTSEEVFRLLTRGFELRPVDPPLLTPILFSLLNSFSSASIAGPSAARPKVPAEGVSSSMVWSPLLEIPIGGVQAGLALDAGGLVVDAALAGDFMQDREAPAQLRARLVGQRPERTMFAGALNATYGAAGDAVIEGVRTLETLLDAFMRC